MKNILYISYVDYGTASFPGVEAKIADQTKSLQNAGYCVDHIHQFLKDAELVQGQSGKNKRFKSKLSKRFAIFKAVKWALDHQKYEGAYIRFQFFSEDVRRITALLKKNCVSVVMEFPTYPYEGELHRQGFKGEIKLLCDRIFRKSCAANIDAFITQTNNNSIYGVPCVSVINGLDYKKHALRKVRTPRSDELHMVAVASMLPWHGYDRMLLGMADYYRMVRSTNVVLHLVGEGCELEKYRRITIENNLNNHVIFHGRQQGQDLERIVSDCDIAVGSLAAFRIGIDRLSTLKSREYCAWGFPTINATDTDILCRDDPFCLFVSEDESPIDVETVVAFYKKVYFESGMDAKQIAEQIRSEAQKCSDIETVFQPVIDFFERGMDR